jgi:GT2 family glycosyltransferase
VTVADAAGAPEAWVTRSPRPVVTVPEHRQPELSVVLVTYGTGPIVIEGISALVDSLAASDIAYEVVVVDNEHPDRPDRASVHLLLDTAGVRVVRPMANLGFGSGCNLGVERARGSMICLLNPDVAVGGDWLAPLLAAIEGGAAIAAPVLSNPDGTVQSAGHHLWGDASTTPITDVPATLGRPVYASAACWILSRATYDALEGFDTVFHPAYYEDVDFALRARSLGGTVVVGSSRVTHRHGASTSTHVVPDTTPQRDRLLAKWPDLAELQPAPPT